MPLVTGLERTLSQGKQLGSRGNKTYCFPVASSVKCFVLPPNLVERTIHAFYLSVYWRIIQITTGV